MPIWSFTLYHNSYFAFATSSILLPQVLYSVTMLRTFGMYLKSDGLISINERRDLNLLKSYFKALHNTETWPDYLERIKQECCMELRSSNSIRLVVPTKNGTFQDNTSKLFNNLPETIRNCKDYRTFLRLSRNFLCNRVQSY